MEATNQIALSNHQEATSTRDQSLVIAENTQTEAV